MSTGSWYAPVQIPASSVVGEHCVLGCPKEQRVRAARQQAGPARPGDPVVVGERCLIFNQVVLYEGVRVGDDCVVEDRVRIGYDSRIGRGSRLMYGAWLCDRVTVGADARVGGFVCDGTRIGERSTLMGDLVHEYTRPHLDWWEVDEAPPLIEPDTVIGYGAQVVGGVRIGPRSYVAAGAVVTRDVPPEHVVTGVNVVTLATRWPGSRLQELIRHWQTPAVPRR